MTSSGSNKSRVLSSIRSRTAKTNLEIMADSNIAWYELLSFSLIYSHTFSSVRVWSSESQCVDLPLLIIFWQSNPRQCALYFPVFHLIIKTSIYFSVYNEWKLKRLLFLGSYDVAWEKMAHLDNRYSIYGIDHQNSDCGRLYWLLLKELIKSANIRWPQAALYLT